MVPFIITLFFRLRDNRITDDMMSLLHFLRILFEPQLVLLTLDLASIFRDQIFVLLQLLQIGYDVHTAYGAIQEFLSALDGYTLTVFGLHATVEYISLVPLN